MLLLTVLTGHVSAQESQTFAKPGVSTFTVPPNVTSITVECWGAGGGGGSRSNTGRGGGGGGAAYARSTISVTPGDVYQVFVGAGGAADSSGQSSTFAETIVVAAGGGGGTNNSSSGGIGGSLFNSGGSIVYAGGNGANGGLSYSGGGGGGAGSSGNGGNAPGADETKGAPGTGTLLSGGEGGAGTNNNAAGNPGTQVGGGGSGAKRTTEGEQAGGRGADGQVVVSWCIPPVITVQPAAPDVVCADDGTQTMTVVATGTNLNYTWRKDGMALVNGKIISGQGTPVLVLTNPTSADDGWYDVWVSNDCGTAESSPFVHLVANTVPAQPDEITGSTECAPLTAQTYSTKPVSNATSYLWTIPNGWTITSGEGTNSISVMTGSTEQTENISVLAVNTCGNSEPRTLEVSVTTEPAEPEKLKSATGMMAAMSQDYINPGTYTFTVPPGATSISVEAWGSGSGGDNTADRGGGGGAYAADYSIAVVPGTNYTVVVGAGAAVGSGDDGQTSRFGTVVVAAGATGGTGGTVAASTGSVRNAGGNGGYSTGNGGAGGGGSAGAGGNGGNGGNTGNDNGGTGGVAGVAGAGTAGAAGGAGGNRWGSGVTGSFPGGGGGERGESSGSSGGGGNGRVLVTWNIADDFCYGYGYSVYAQTGVTNPSDALNAPNDAGAVLNEGTDVLDLDLTGGGVTRLSGSEITIRLRRTVNQNATVAWFTSNDGTNWTPNGTYSTIAAGWTDVTITLNADTRYLRIDKTNYRGFEVDAITYDCCTDPAQPSVISGNPNPCPGSSETYSVTDVSGVTYTWAYSGTNASITSGQGTNSITVSYAANATSGIWTVTPSVSSCTGSARTLAVLISTPSTNATSVTGTNSICIGSSTTLTTNGGTLGTDAEDVWYEGGCATEAVTQEWLYLPYTVTNTTVNSITGGIMSVTSTNNDPMIHMENIGNYSADFYHFIQIRYRVTGGNAGSVEIYYSKNGGGDLGEGQVVRTALVSDGNWNIVNVDMSASANWTGNITGWRYDWSTQSGVTMEIDFITLADRPIIGVGPTITVSPTVTTSYSTMKKGACNNTACRGRTVTVNPLPTMTSANAKTICSGDNVGLALTADIPSSYSWVATANGNITGESTSNQATATINDVLVNTTTSVQTITYTVTPTSNTGSCAGTPQTVTITVNPAPTMTSVNTKAICSGDNVGLALTSDVPSSYSWIATSNSNVTGESTSAQSSATINDVLVNTTASVQTVTYTVTPTATTGSCAGTPQTVTITVNPMPTMSSASSKTICSGDNVSLALTSAVPSSYSWIATANANVNGESISAQSSATISDVLVNTTTSVQTVIYTVTPTSNTGSCTGTPQTVTITVNPAPTMTSANAKTICSGDNVGLALTSDIPSSYSWVATANGNITGESTSNQATATINDVLVNTTTSVQTVTYTVTPTANTGSCAGTPQTVTITVNPMPTMSSASSKTICSGENVNLALTSAVPSNYSWVATPNGNITGESTSNQATATINDVLVNTTASVQTVTYTVTPTATTGSCAGTPQTVTITVNPMPTMSSASSKTICSGDNVNLALTSAVPSSYSWIATANTNVNGESISAQSSATISDVLVNTTTSVQTVIYTVTPTSNTGSCTGTPQTVTITVNPAPTMTSANAKTICSGDNVGLALTSDIPSSYSWVATANGNVNGESTSNQATATINDVLVNTTTSVQTVTYTVTPTSNTGSCAGTPQTVTITVNPAPTMSSASSKTICSGDNVNLALTSDVPSGYSWIANANTNITGESTSAQSSATISDVLVNTTTSVQTVIYTVTPTATTGSCAGTPQTVTITVNPMPTMSSASSKTICSGENVNLALTSNVPSNYSWIATANANVNGESISAQSSATISDVLVNTTTSVQTITYTVTPTSNTGSCTGTPQTVTITVNPAPTMTSANAKTICSGDNVGLALTSDIPSSYSWVATANGNVNGESTSNQATATINDVLVNTTTSVQTVTYTVTPTSNTGNCAGAPQTVTITVNPNATIALTSAAGTNTQSSCINNAITNITYAIGGGGTGANVTGLPAGVSGNYAGGVVTISGTPTATGTFSYTVTTTGTCTQTSANGTITVNPDATISLSSAAGTDNQTRCVNNAITNITYAIGGGGTGANVTGLPAGVSGNYAGGIVTISGTPTASGTFSYTVTTTGTCTQTSATGTITVNPDATISLTSAAGTTAQNICISNPITNITYAIGGGGTGATVSGLPAGVTGNYAGGIVTISGTPTATGTFSYTVTTTGTCTQTSANGTITVNPDATISLSSAAGTDNQTRCINNAITNITYSIGGGGTGATVTGLPAGVSGNYAGGIVTISGTPTATGTFNYTVTTTGSCTQTSATGSITVNPDATISLTSAAGTNAQNICISNSINSITYAIGGGGTGANVSGLPAGVSGNYAGGVFTISGTPTASGTFNYTVTTTGTCNQTSANGTIVVSPASVSGTASADQTICNGNSPGNITLTGNTGTIQWQVSTDNSVFTDIAGANSSPLTGAQMGALNATRYYRAVVTSGVCSSSTSNVVTVTVLPTPTATIAGTTSVCQNTAAPTVIFSNPMALPVTVTYNINGGGSQTINIGANSSSSVTQPTASVGTFNYNLVSVQYQAAPNCPASVSGNATVTVRPETPAVPGAPVGDVLVNPATSGISYTITAVANATSYTWTVPTGWTIQSGQGTTSITVKSGVAGQNGDITVSASNDCGTSATNKLNVQVNPDLALVTHPASQTDCYYNVVTFQVTISGGATPITYTWQRKLPADADFTNIVGDPDIDYPSAGTMRVKDVGSTTNPGGTQYRVVVADASGLPAATSNAATLTVNRVSTITPTSAQTICEGGNASFTGVTEGETPISYQWKKYPGGTNVVNGGSISGATTPTLTITNATVADAGEYRLQAVFPTCTSTSYIGRELIVNPLPVLNGPALVCVGGNINWTPNTGGTWISSDPTKATIDNTGLVTGIAPGTVTFTFTITATGCYQTSAPVTVYPRPDVVANPAAQTICSGSATAIAISSADATASFSWTVVQSGVSGASNGTGATIAQTLTTTGNVPGTATYTITPSANGCDGTAVTVVVTVNPVPNVTVPANIVVCNGAPATGISFTGSVAGTTFNWTNDAPSIGLAASGTGNIADFSTTNAGLSPATATITVTPVFTNAGTTCTGTAKTFTITVNPAAQANKPADIVICNGSNTPAISFTSNNSGGTTTYSWTNDNTSIGLALTGTGNIASFAASNNSVSPKIANIVVTPHFTYGGVTCDGPGQAFTITVNPTPVATATPSTQTICSGENVAIALSSTVTGTTFAWTIADAPAGSISGATAGTGASIAQTLVNTTPNPATLTYTITPTAYGCNGTPVTAVITVNPKPVLSSTLTPADICSNSLFSYTPTSATAGTTFSWTRASILGITPLTGSGTNNPNETLVNISAAPIDVVYVYTLTANGCTNTQNVVVRVLPELTLSSALSTTTCSNSLFTYNPTSILPVTFDWSRAAVAGISNAAATGTGAVSETLINTTPAAIDVIYVYTLKVGSCVGTQNVRVTVKPSPTLTSSQTPPDICNNTAFTYTATSATVGTTFSWYRPTVAGISNGPGAGASATVNETLINTTANPITVRYEFTLRAAGCQSLQYVDVVVKPTPTLSSSLTPPGICTNSAFSYTPTSATAGTTFAWSRAVVAGISNAAASGTDNPNETLVNTSGAPVTVTYSYTLTANGCTNTQNVTVVVNPLPIISVTPATPDVCLGSGTTLTASGAVTYTWSPATGLSATTGTSVTASPVTTTTYTVTGTDANGCVGTTTVTVNVLPKPTITVSPDIAICRGSSTTLTASGGVSYTWAPATGLSATTGESVTANPTSTTTYTVTGTDANGCTNTATVKVTVNPPPTITITSSSSSICSGGSATLTASGAGVGGTYEWFEDGVSFSTDATVTVSPSANTTYTVNGTNASGCTGTRTVTVTIRPLPILTNANPPDLCSSHLFTFNPTTSIAGTTWTWTRPAVPEINTGNTANGTGNISETLTSTSTTSITVIYEFTLTAPTGCTNTVTVPVLVVPAPAVTVNASSNSLCATQSFDLTSSTPEPTIATNLINENFNALGNPANWQRTSTNGTAAWTLQNSGYSYGFTTFRSDDNSRFYLANSSAAGNTNITSTLRTPQFSTVGYTSATLTFWHYYRDGGSSDQAIVRWSTNGTSGWTNLDSYTGIEGSANGFVQKTYSLPTGQNSIYVQFYYEARNDYYWAIDNVVITGEIAPTVVWSSSPNNPGFGNPTTYNVNNVTQTQTTTYTASYTYPGFNCPGQASITITTLPSPIIPNQTAPGICSGGTFTVTPVDGDPGTTVPAGTTYSWAAPAVAGINGEAAGTNATSISGTLTNTTNNTINVVYNVTATTPGTPNCTGTFTVTVPVYPTPTVNAIANQPAVCSGTAGAAINFGSNVSGVTYDWTSTADVGFGTSGTGNIPAYTKANTSGARVTATVSVTATANGCTGPATNFTIIVDPMPVITIEADYCTNAPKITLTANPAGLVSYTWYRQGSATPIASGSSNQILVDIADIYQVVAVNSNGCTGTAFSPVANNLVVNGDFEMGPAGAGTFYTEYTFDNPPDGYMGVGVYGIGTNARDYYTAFRGAHDHTSGSGYYMIVDGTESSKVVWRQTITVKPNTNYYFSAWAINLYRLPYPPNYDPNLRFSINGTLIGTEVLVNKFTNSDDNPWLPEFRFYGMWNSGSQTTAVVEIRNLVPGLQQNDFGLDDISFGTLDPVPGTINPSVDGTACMNGDLHLRANKTSTKEPFTYSWTGPNGWTSTEENPVITNLTAANTGRYSLTFNDGFGCTPLNGYVDVTVSDNPVCSITGPLTTIPNATDTYTAPAGMTTYEWSVTGTGTISGASNLATVNVLAGADCSGSYTVSLTVTNASGCSSTCTQVVDMNDTSGPVVTGTLPNQTVEGCSVAVSTPATTVAALEAMGITIDDAFTPDNLLVVTSSDVTSGSCPITVTRTYTITDACGNPVDLIQTITVDDTTPPVVTGSLAVLPVEGCAATDVPAAVTTVAALEAFGGITIADACTTDKALLTVTSSDATSGTCPVVVTRTYTIEDACGNPATLTQTIQIQDTTPPTWTTAAGSLDITLQCSDLTGLTAAQLLAPVATDGCSGVQAPVKTTGAFVPSGTCTNAGTYTNTWTVQDACGNPSATIFTQTITIIDDTKPTWITPPVALNVYLECSDAAGIAAAQLLMPEATDNCDNTLTVTKITGPFVPGAAPCTQAGSYTNTFTATDDCGNVSDVFTQMIMLEDNTPPEVIAPPTAVISCSGSTAPAITGLATATDACGGAVDITFADAPPIAGSCPGTAQIIRTWTATDACGNFATATQNIFTQDITPPTITTPAQNTSVVCDGSGNTTDLNNWLNAHANAVASDDCGPINWTNDFTTLTTSCGSTTVTFTATDGCGNATTTQATFTITDTTAPVITCPAPASGTSDLNECFSTSVVLGTPTVTDNCSPAAEIVITNNAPAQYPVGVTIVTWTATDVCGNTSTCDQTVTVTDNNQPPVIACPADVVQTAGPNNCYVENVVIPNPATSDNCAVTTLTWATTGATTLSSPATGINYVSGQTFNVGVTTVTYTASDAAGNSASCSFTVTIRDITPPTVNIANCVDVSETAAPNNCSKTPTTLLDPVYSDTCWPLASLTLSWTMTGATTGSGLGTVTNLPFNVGITTVTYTVTDPDGNSANCSFTVTILDVTPPSVGIAGCEDVTDITDAANCTHTPGAINDPVYSDSCWDVSDLSITWVMTGATTGSGSGSVKGQSFNAGVTTVTYTVTDPDGNSATCDFDVTIIPFNPPQFTAGCPSDVSEVAAPGLCSTEITLPAPSVTDLCNIGYTVTNDHPGTTFDVGVTQVIWTITPTVGTPITCTQTVTVTDTQAPAITGCVNVEDFITNGGCTKVMGTFTEPTFSDNCPASLVLSYSLVYPDGTTATGTGSVSSLPFPAGVTQVTYSVTDAGGLTATCSFTVTIKNLLAPTLTVDCSTAANISQNVDAGLCTADVTVPAPTINNPCNEVYTQTWEMTGATIANSPLTGVNYVSTHTFNFGQTTIVWTITDASGNVSNCTQTVTVTGTQPSLSCPASITEFADFMLTYKDNLTVPVPTYAVTCGVPLLTWQMVDPSGVTTTGTGDPSGINLVPSPGRFYVGVTTITYTVADINGNSNSCSFTITILAKPEITCLLPVNYVADPGVCYHTVQQADADNPGTPTLDSGSQPIDWTWTITNPDGSTATGGSSTDLLNPNPTKIGPYNFQKGVSTILWRAENPSGYDECTQTVTVTENEPPTFTLPAALDECVLPIQQAIYDPTNLSTDNYSPNRPDYYVIKAGSTRLDLTNLADNCCAVADMIIHWRIDFEGGTPSISGTGQPSAYGSDILLPGDGVTYGTLNHTMSFWIEDCEGTIYPEQQVSITIRPRPNLIKMP